MISCNYMAIRKETPAYRQIASKQKAQHKNAMCQQFFEQNPLYNFGTNECAHSDCFLFMTASPFRVHAILSATTNATRDRWLCGERARALASSSFSMFHAMPLERVRSVYFGNSFRSRAPAFAHNWKTENTVAIEQNCVSSVFVWVACSFLRLQSSCFVFVCVCVCVCLFTYTTPPQ